LQVLEASQDGFAIAEADLRLRGPGELLGQAQSGLPPFRFGDLANDLELIRRARTLAAQLLAATASHDPASGRAGCPQPAAPNRGADGHVRGDGAPGTARPTHVHDDLVAQGGES
jgi:hypothetical protein